MVACNQEAARLLEWAEKQPDAIMDVNAHGLMVDQVATEVSSQMHGVLHIVIEGAPNLSSPIGHRATGWRPGGDWLNSTTATPRPDVP